MTFTNKELRTWGVSERVLEARALRRRLKIPQREFAAMAGLCLKTVEQIELGRRVTEASLAKFDALLIRWRESPPEQKAETRGGWRRRLRKPVNDVAAGREAS